MIRKIIRIDKEKCIGCGMCSAAYPEVFELNDAGKAEAVSDTTDSNCGWMGRKSNRPQTKPLTAHGRIL